MNREIVEPSAFRPIRRISTAWKVRSTEPSLSTPALFIGLAERLGKLPELGRAIRRRTASALPPDGTKLFVNLHASDLEDDDLYRQDSPFSKLADRVVLEVTERVSLADVKDLAARIARLRGMGFMIAVDDLGAGYAGLTSLTELEPDVAKLDMSLVRSIHLNPLKQGIVRAMSKVCSELDIVVVAEGVEAATEREALLDLGCSMLQRHLFARPDRDFPAPCWG